MACDECVQQALGVASEADYIAKYGASAACPPQLTYCVDENLVIPPSQCALVVVDDADDTSFDFDHRFSPADGDPITFNNNGNTSSDGQSLEDDGRHTDITWTNTACYPMNLVYNFSSFVRFSLTQPDPIVESSINMQFRIQRADNGNPLVEIIRAGGTFLTTGNNNDPIDTELTAFTYVDPTPVPVGDTVVLHLTSAVGSIATEAVFSGLIAFAGAVRTLALPTDC